MNVKKAKKLRQIARKLAAEQETSYTEVNKHAKMIRQQLSESEIKKRFDSTSGDFNTVGFSEGVRFVAPNILETVVTVSQKVIHSDCFRGKYKGLKKNWNTILGNLSPDVAKSLEDV